MNAFLEIRQPEPGTFTGTILYPASEANSITVTKQLKAGNQEALTDKFFHVIDVRKAAINIGLKEGDINILFEGTEDIHDPQLILFARKGEIQRLNRLFRTYQSAKESGYPKLAANISASWSMMLQTAEDIPLPTFIRGELDLFEEVCKNVLEAENSALAMTCIDMHSATHQALDALITAGTLIKVALSYISSLQEENFNEPDAGIMYDYKLEALLTGMENFTKLFTGKMINHVNL